MANVPFSLSVMIRSAMETEPSRAAVDLSMDNSIHILLQVAP